VPIDPENPLVDLDAEREVLAFFLNAGAIGDTSAQALLAEHPELQPAIFSSPRNALVMEAITATSQPGQDGANTITVSQYLKDKRKLHEAGGPAYIMSLDSQALFTATGLGRQIQRLRQMAMRRRGIASCQMLADALKNPSQSPEDVLIQMAGELAVLAAGGAAPTRTLADFARDEYEAIEDIQDGKSPENARYILSGIRVWDELLQGVQRKKVTMVGAHPGVGKSGLLNTMALSIAEGDPIMGRPPIPVACFSLEDEGTSIPRRYFADGSVAAIRQLMKRGGLSTDQRTKLSNTAARIHNIGQRVFIDDRTGLTVQKVAARAKQWIIQHGVGVIFVDHLLEMVDFKDERARDERVGEILRVLRDLAKEMDVAVVLAAHLKDPQNAQVDAIHLRPRAQDFAGGRYVDRMCRLAVGLWLPPAPSLSDFMKGYEQVKEPKLPDSLSPNEKAERLEKWQEKKRAADADYQKRHRAWQEACDRAGECMVVTVLKANEGDRGFDFLLKRIRHAGLVSRVDGEHDASVLGYTRAKAA